MAKAFTYRPWGRRWDWQTRPWHEPKHLWDRGTRATLPCRWAWPSLQTARKCQSATPSFGRATIVRRPQKHPSSSSRCCAADVLKYLPIPRVDDRQASVITEVAEVFSKFELRARGRAQDWRSDAVNSDYSTPWWWKWKKKTIHITNCVVV